MLSNFQKPVTRWQRTAEFCWRENKSWLHVLRWPSASKSRRRLQSPAAHRIHLPAGRRASTHSTQNRLWANCPDFITKDEWPPNSPDLNPVDYHVLGAMLEAYRKLKTKPETMAELIRKRFRLSGATCHRDRSTRLWKTSQSDWRLVLELVVDTSNIHSDSTKFWHLIIS